jgi:hypothetical protein
VIDKEPVSQFLTKIENIFYPEDFLEGIALIKPLVQQFVLSND